jgi:hypothetical protein
MAAKIRVDWPSNMLTVEKTAPSEKEGIRVVQGNDGVQLDMIFAGKMTAQIDLKKPD